MQITLAHIHIQERESGREIKLLVLRRWRRKRAKIEDEGLRDDVANLPLRLIRRAQ